VHEIDASLAALYLPAGSPLSPARGRLTVSAAFTQTPDGLQGALDAGFAGVELRRPGQDVAYLTAPAVRVKVDDVRVRSGALEVGRLAVDGGTLQLEDTRLKPARRWQVDGVALEARNLSSARGAPPGVASARAATSGARLEVWVTNARLAPLELAATAIVRNVDLSLARLYLPPELPARPERGTINATVRVEHGVGHPTRLALDASVGGLELWRPGHYVTAPAVRVTADDVALDAGVVAVGRLAVTSDRLMFEERTAKPVRTWPIQNLVAEARDLSSRRDAVQGVASLRATVAGAAASVYLTGARLQPLELHATTILRNMDAAFVRHYLPADVPVELRRGLVNATVQIDHAVDATRLTGDATLTGLQAVGRDAFATASVTAPSVRLSLADGLRRGEALSVGRVELTGTGSLTDSRGAAARFDFSRIHVATEGLTWPVTAPARVEMSMRFQDRGELDGSGTARLTRPLPTIAWTADLALKFRGVDLTPLALYVPAAGGLGGRVRADVTASLAYADTLTARVRGDVGGARFALVDGDQTLLALRSMAVTGLDLDWPERMSIKRLRLREPQAFVTRDRQGVFPLAARFAAAPAAPSPPTGPGVSGGTDRRVLKSIAIDEVVVENGSASFVDEGAVPAVRIDLPRVGLTARNVTWPATTAISLALDGAFLNGGTVKADGTVTVEPAAVDLTLACQEADLAPLQPYMGFRARVGGRLDASLTVAGQLAPAPRLKITGEAGLRSLDISDGQRSVITADRVRVRGIDADWPTRVALDRVRVRRAWAAIERDAQGNFLLRDLFERPEARRPVPFATGAPKASAPPSPAMEFSFREGIFEEQSATIVDAARSPAVRLDVAGARLVVTDFSYPQRALTKVELKSPMPGSGQLQLTGTVQLVPTRIVARTVLDDVAIDALQAYVPIEGRMLGAVSGDLNVKLGLEPVAVQVTGQARLARFRLNDGDRAVVTVGRLDTSGIDVDWPRRVALQSVKLRRPRLLIERGEDGQFRLRRLVTPRWETPASSDSPTPASPASSAPPPTAVPQVEIGTLSLEKALARFVDYVPNPDYAEELEDLDVTISPLTTIPGRPTRFAATGVISGGAFKVHGEGMYGERPTLDMALEIKNLVVPRANPYVMLYTGWKSSSGSLDATGVYKVNGTQLETRHDVVVRGLAVAPVDERDEVAHRVGLPFGMLVSLLQDSRGEIRLSLPVSGDLSTREFQYKEALWASVRNLSIRLLALPFSKIGSLAFSNDSKMQAVSLAPVVFEPGTDRFGAGMGPHLQAVGEFLRGKPSMKVILEPVLIDADLQALKRALVQERLSGGERDPLARAQREYRGRWPDRPAPPTLEAIIAELATAEPLPPDAVRILGTRRIDAVRASLTQGGVDPARLSGTARRAPLVEAAGNPRVELDLRS
jgi:hypothetical protein